METVTNLQLKDENVYPDEKILSNVLGKSYKAFKQLMKLFDDNEMTHEWRFYSDGKAWLCKVQKKKRTIVWMSAWPGYVKAAVYIPKRLIDNVYALGISEETRQNIKTTKDVGKSKPCIFDVKDIEIIVDFEKVMQYKIVNK